MGVHWKIAAFLPDKVDETSRCRLLDIFSCRSLTRHGEHGSTQLCFLMSSFG
jgi:hypothetical protein